MKQFLFTLLLAASATAATAPVPDRALRQLPNGDYYFPDEVDFCLKAEPARALSAADNTRHAVDTTRLVALHPAIIAVVGGHLSAARWLSGEALPAALNHTGADVPVIARSLKAILRAGEDAAVVAEELRKHPEVQWMSLNRVHPPTHIPNDTFWGNQWGPSRVNATNGWDVAQASTTVRVAVIDTGVDLTHPDLASRITYNQGFGGNASGDAQRDARGGGSIDHGTHVAGIAAAIRDNSQGVAGIATAQIMAMGCATWTPSENAYWICCAADALNDAIANGATAVNCSFGNSSLDSATSNALNTAQAQGVVVVCAAGNDGTDVSLSPSAGWDQHTWPLIVSNVAQDDTRTLSSNYGSAIDLGAPGMDIYSTFTTNYTRAVLGGTYGYMNGTSMASPHVAGAIAMVRGMNPSRILGFGAKDFLYRTAQDIGPAGRDNDFGNGMLQLPASFLSVLKRADTFAGYNPWSWLSTSPNYELPYVDVASAVAATPAGGTIVLNGGIGGPRTYTFPAVTISTPVTLTAFPDYPVTIGRQP